MRRFRSNPGSIAAKIAVLAVACFAFLPILSLAQSPNYAKIYPKMAPLSDYLMNRDAEIALARSAAPEAISRDASVLVLTSHGWETAVKGTNGFVCMVERGWASSIEYNEMWNPKMKGPDCLNAAAARTIVPMVLRLTKMALAGDSPSRRVAGMKAAFAQKEIPPLEPGAIGYMLSKQAYLTDGEPHNIAHIMFFVPGRVGSDWGAGVPNSPIFSFSYWFPRDAANPLNKALPPLHVSIVLVPAWSDGSSAVVN